MEPVSHIVLGSAINRGLLRLPGERGTGLAIALGALSPDIDLLLLAAGWDRYLVAHQAGTHSVIGAALCGALAAVVARALRPRSTLRMMVLPAVVAALSHLLADLLSAGTLRLLWPVLDTPISNAGAVAFGDPYSGALFLIGGLTMWIWKSRRRQCAIAVLAAFALLCGGKFVSRERAVASFRASMPAHHQYLLEPVWGSLTEWTILEGSPDRVRVLTADWSGGRRVVTEAPRVMGDAATIDASRVVDAVRNLTRSHEFAFALAVRDADGTGHAWWSDLRYCPPRVVNPDNCAIAVIVETNPAGEITRRAVRIGDFVQPR